MEEQCICQKISPIPLSGAFAHSEGHKKRKRGQFESDCESMSDNFSDHDLVRSYYNRHKRGVSNNLCSNYNRHERQTLYIWTDQRLQLLVTTFYDYVMNPDVNISLSDLSERHLLLLGKLRHELLTLANDDEAQDSPTFKDITDELNDFALLLENKYPRYYELKARLGERISKKYRILVRHKKFHDYVPMGGTPRCDTYSTNLSKPPVGLFYWIDIRLQHLVLSYFMVLQDSKSDSREQENKGGKCLMALKKRLHWNVSIPQLKHKLNEIFKDYQENSLAYREFRIRIGKDMCIQFDHLVKLEWDLYKNKDTTSKTYSKSGSSSSRHKSSASRMSLVSSANRMSLGGQRQADIDSIKNELQKSELNDRQIAFLMIKFADENLRCCFWSCSAEQRKYFLEELLK